MHEKKVDIFHKKDVDIDDTNPISSIELNKILIECLKPMDKYPDVAKEALIIAEKYCYEEALVSELEVAKRKCQDYLDKKRITFNFNKKETCMVRAVMCILSSEFRPCDLDDILEFFEDMMKRLGKNSKCKRAFQKIKFPW